MQAYLFVIDYQNDFVDGALSREKPKSAQGKPRAGRKKSCPGFCLQNIQITLIEKCMIS